MDDVVEQKRQLHNVVRIGTIADVDHVEARARFADDDLLTGWLPWLEQRAGATRTWNPPTVGEQCLLLSPGGDPANAVVLPAIYSGDRPAPSDDADVTRTVYPDGAVIEYDHAAHNLTAHIPGSAQIDCETFVSCRAGGNVDVESGGRATVTAEAGITLNGDVTINGQTTFNGQMLHGGRRVDSTHRHTGVQIGKDQSGPVT